MKFTGSKALGVVFGLVVVGGANADCHESMRQYCREVRAECLANPPPGTFPATYCQAIYEDCLIDAGCTL